MAAHYRNHVCLIILVTLAFVFTACTHRYYYPKPLQPPLLSAKNQVRLNGISNLNPVNPIVAVSLAGSPIHHLGLQVSTASASFKETTTSSGVETVHQNERQWNPEVAAGYYKSLSRNILVEVYAGWGAYNYTNDAPAFVKSLKHRSYFLQPSIALKDQHEEVAFTLRYDLLQRRSVLLDPARGSATDPEYSFLAYDRYGFLEPGFTMRFGFKSVLMQIGVSQNFALRKNYETLYGNFKKSGSTKVAFGLVVNLHTFFEPQGE